MVGGIIAHLCFLPYDAAMTRFSKTVLSIRGRGDLSSPALEPFYPVITQWEYQ